MTDRPCNGEHEFVHYDGTPSTHCYGCGKPAALTPDPAP